MQINEIQAIVPKTVKLENSRLVTAVSPGKGQPKFSFHISKLNRDMNGRTNVTLFIRSSGEVEIRSNSTV